MDVIDFIRYLGALAFVLALVGAAALAARRFGLAHLVQPQNLRRLQLVESLSLGPKQRLVLVRKDDSEFLVLISADTASAIGDIAPAAVVPSPEMPDVSAPAIEEAIAHA
jgi:flagellar protein FliO/FliZ